MKARKWLVALLAVVMTCMMGVAFAACEPVLPEEGGETPTAEFTVTYYVGAKKYISKQVEYGNFAENLTPPDKEGSDFLYWCSDALMEHEFDFSTPITRDTNLYARYTLFKVYTATFDSAIPGKAVDVRRVQQHDTLTLPAAPVWEEGHKFLNWKNSDGTEYEVGATIPLEDDAEGNAPVLAFTAQWEAYTMAKTDKVDPTCTVDGNPAYFTCSACHKHYTAEDHFEECTTLVTPKTGHTYGDPVWQWNGKAHTATATFTCTKCEDGVDGHVVPKDATVPGGVTSKDPTCTEAGDMTYTATVEFNGKTYSDTITVVGEIPATGHAMTEHPAKDATCEKPGNVQYFTCDNESGDVYYKDRDGSDTLETVEIAQKEDHEWSAWEKTFEGHSRHTVCENVEHDVITESDKHTFKNGKCTVCDYTISTKHLFITGSVAGGSWGKNSIQFEQTDAYTYSVTLELYTGDAFKVIIGDANSKVGGDADYSNSLDYYDLGGNVLTTDGCFNHSDEGDYNIAVKKDGVYTLTVKTLNTEPDSNSKITYVRVSDIDWNLYVYGSMNGWAKNEDYKLVKQDDGTYTCRVKAEAGAVYKVVDIGKVSERIRYFDNDTNNNLTIANAGNYIISFNITTHRIICTRVQYTVSYNANYPAGTEGKAIDPATVTEGTNYTLATPDVVENYEFLGWKLSTDDGAEPTLYTKYVVNGNVEFVGVWRKLQNYTLRFDLSEYKGEGPDVDTYKDRFVQEGKTEPLPEAPVWAGHTFLGWSDGEKTYNGSFKMPRNDVTLTAKYTENESVTVTWYVDGDKKGSKQVPIGTTFSQDDITNAEAAEGKIIDGWYTDDSYSVPYKFGERVMGAVNLYARSVPAKVAVTYMDGKTTLHTETIAGATAATYTAKKGYKKVDIWENNTWYTDKDCEHVYAGEKLIDDTTLYLKAWTEIEVTSFTVNNTEYVIVGAKSSQPKSSLTKLEAWNPNSDIIPVPRDTSLKCHNVFTVTLDLYAGDTFRIIVRSTTKQGGNWVWGTSYGYDKLTDAETQNGQAIKTTDSNNMQIQAGYEGRYKFILAFDSNGEAYLTYELLQKITVDHSQDKEGYYLVGSMTGWADLGCKPIYLGPKKASGTYTTEVTITKEDFQVNDGKQLDHVEAKVVEGSTSGEGFSVSNWDVLSGNYSFPADTGTFKVTFTFSATSKKLTAEKINTFSLTYDLDGVENGGGTYSDLPETKLAQAKYSFAIPEAEPEKAGFHFLGWQLDSDAENLHKAGETIDLAPGAHTLKAVFVNEYTITFEQGNYPGSNWKVDKTITSFDGATITLPELPDPENGQTYKKVWKKDGVEYTETTYKVTGDATFTAEYTLLGEPVEVTITWNVEGEDSSTTTPMSGDPIVAPEKSKEGYVFDGWYSEEGYNPDKKVAAEDLGNAQAGRVYHFYGRFIRSTITVTFYAQDGSEIVANKMTVTTDTENPKALTVDTTSKDKGTVKRFFTFQHWSTDAETDTVFTSGTEIIDDLNLYAWCTEDAESVGYVENNITYSVVGVRKTADKPSSLPTDMEDPTKATNPSLPLTKDTSYTKHNVFTIELDLYVGDWFQIVHEMSWDNQMGFVYLNQDDPLACPFFSNKAGSTSGNIIVKAGQAGRYRFTLYMKNKSYGVANASLSYEKLQSYEDTTPMVDTTGRKVNITGTMNGWTLGNTSHKLTFVGSTIDNNVSIYVFAAKYTFNSSVEFKFSSNNDWGSWEGNKGNTEINCNNGPYGNNGNITLSAGTYCFYYSMTINGRCYSAIFNASRY